VESAHILLADDDALLRALYGDALAAAGYRVCVAEDGEAAREALLEGRFDLLVTDLVMPRMGGLELLELAKGRDPDLGVIVLTGVSAVEPAVRALRAGAFHYLTKPLDPEALVIEAARCLEHNRVLRENRELRRHHRLLLGGARLLAAQTADGLGRAVTEVVRATLGADAVVYGRGGRSTFRVDQTTGVSAAVAASVASACMDAAMDSAGVVAVPGHLGGFTQALWLDARPRTEGAPPARALALRRADSAGFDTDARYDADILSESLSLALDNVDHLDRARVVGDIDALTGLWNARALESTIDRELAARGESRAPFSVLFMDLDHFKRVNDTHGHLVGSAVLVEMARLLRRCLRAEDVLVRYGGDEYVAVLLDADTSLAVAVAERIRAMVEGHRFMAREGHDLRLTLCCGVATWPLHASTRAEIMHRADLAMYRGKKAHRNAVWVWTAESIC
jgi:diguanylate cyclase (GGDEF)-like protein